MEMRIVVEDAPSAFALAARMSAVFGAERVSLGSDRQEVEVELERGSDRAIVHVVDAVERWLDEVRVGWAELWLGHRSYRSTRSLPPFESWQ